MVVCDKKIKFFSVLAVACACAFTSLFCSVFTSSALSTVSNDISVTIPGSIAMRLLDSTATQEISSLSFDLTPTPSGTQATKRAIVDIATSNPTGYKLYMQSNYQKGGNYTTNLIHQDASVSDSIPTSTSASTLYWNYNNPLTSTTNTIPAHGHPDKIAQHFETTNSDQVPVDINVSVDNTIVSGTYENQLLFSAVGNPTNISYKLDFNAGSGTMTGTDIEESAAAWTHSITIPGNPSTNNYTDYIPTGVNALFTGWVISIPTGSSTTASCNSTNICHPGDAINITGSVDQSGDMVGEVTLTAQYVSISTMQAMTPTICNTATIGAATTLTDTRDSSTYTIRKLKDGNCWMTQNLRLTGPQSLNLTNSDVALDFVLPTQTEDYDDGSADPTANMWCAAQNQNCTDRTVNLYSNNVDYGTYYTWRAATAGEGTWDVTSGNVNSSICPKGWKLPTGGSIGEFRALYDQYPSVEAMRDVSGPALVLSGNRNAGSTNNQGINGRYWTSTSYEDYRAYRLVLDSSSVVPTGRGTKYGGFTVRCLAQNTTKSVLGVDPNGGTWNGSTKGQTFAGTAGETKTISNPTTGPTYNISFNMSTSGMPAPANIAVARPFTSWSLSGAGSFAGGTYTYGAGNGTLTAQYSTTSNTFTLPSINNGFAGTCKWAEGSPTGTQYSIGASRTVTGDTTYYAVCTMQAMTTSICSNAAIDTMATLTDIRDNNTYSVRKLKDSKCWMTQNLRIVGPRTLTSADSNVASNFNLTGSNSGTWCTEQSSSACYNQSMVLDSGNNDYGAYYNWYAATAGTGTYELVSSNATSSVCPKGWRLPVGRLNTDVNNESNEFQTLFSYYNSYDLMVGDPAFVLSGYRLSGTTIIDNNGTFSGKYWSSSPRFGAYVSVLQIISYSSGSKIVIPGGQSSPNYKLAGFSIRCLAQ